MTEQLNIAELRLLHAGMPDTVDKFVYMAHLKMPALLDAAEERDSLRADLRDLRDVLIRNNFAPCDSPACNCNSWHERSTGGGFYARFREIDDAVGDHDGKTLHQAVVGMVEERDRLKAKLAALVEVCDEVAASAVVGKTMGWVWLSALGRFRDALDAAKVQP